ncbi:hypothetical protein F5883DRAFT_649948 [Diaporthe sp. PMI_573]|nr:hypothetical protein F5883DRAFT_649948 [Diaporthaceae sp. PMI_573]
MAYHYPPPSLGPGIPYSSPGGPIPAGPANLAGQVPTRPTNVPTARDADLLLPAFENLAISVSQPDPRAAKPTPAPARPYTYEKVFESIVDFTTALRSNKPLGPDEYKEPRSNHPWARGVDRVISDCASLDILREGLRTVSSGELSITTNVSVIDRWPFLHQKLHNDLGKTRSRAYNRSNATNNGLPA